MILCPLLCQAVLEHPEPHCLLTLSLSRHLGSVPFSSPCHGCQATLKALAAPLAVHLQPLWHHQEPLNWLCFQWVQPSLAFLGLQSSLPPALAMMGKGWGMEARRGEELLAEVLRLPGAAVQPFCGVGRAASISGIHISNKGAEGARCGGGRVVEARGQAEARTTLRGAGKPKKSNIGASNKQALSSSGRGEVLDRKSSPLEPQFPHLHNSLYKSQRVESASVMLPFMTVAPLQ